MRSAIIATLLAITIAVAVLWSEFHSIISGALDFESSQDSSAYVAVFCLVITLLFAAATAIAAFFVRNCRGGLKRITVANSITAFILLLPTMGWILFDHQLALLYVLFAGRFFWPLILVVAIVVNLVMVMRLIGNAALKPEPLKAQESEARIVDVAEARRSSGQRSARFPFKTKGLFFIVVRLLYLYVIVGVGIATGAWVARNYESGVSTLAVISTLGYLLIFAPALVIGFLPTQRVMQSHIAVRSWVGLVAALCLIAPILNFVSAGARWVSNASKPSIDRGAVCIILKDMQFSDGRVPKIDISPAGRGFIRYSGTLELEGQKKCDKLSIESFSPLTVRVYTLTEENQDSRIATSTDHPTETIPTEIPIDGEVCIYISPVTPANRQETEWALRVVRHKERNFMEKIWRLLSVDTDLCAGRSGREI